MQISETTVLRRIALATTIVTGFAGLVYEVTWHKYLSNIVGSEARATAIILAVFLGGLSIGYELFGRISKGKSPHGNLKLLAYSEIAIGIWAFFFDQIFSLLGSLTQNLPLTGVAALGGEILAAAFLMLIPTILMGGTLPLLTQGLNLGLKDAPKFHSKIYACNTAGAFLGCLSAGFYFIPSHGLPLTMFYMSILNLLSGFVLGLVATAVSRKEIATELATSESNVVNQSQEVNETNPLKSSEDYLSSFTAFGVAMLAGFYSIALQTILVRVTGLSLGSSEYAFSMVVSLFIFMLALGASGVSKLENGGLQQLKKNQGLMIIGAGVVYLSMNYWNYINHLIRITFGKSEIAFYGYFAASFLWMGLILSLVLGTMGRTLPLLFSACRQDRDDLGGFIGTLYGFNTLGCVLGALMGGYVGLYYLDLDQIFKVLIALMLVSYVLVSIQKSTNPIKVSWALVLVCIVFAPNWNKKQMGLGLFRLNSEVKDSYSGTMKLHESTFSANQQLLAYKDGPSGTISVYEVKQKSSPAELQTKVADPSSSGASNPETQEKMNQNQPSVSNLDSLHSSSIVKKNKDLDSVRSIVVNGKSDGSTEGPDLVTTKLLAHLPGLLSLGATGNSAVIGFGTGITVGNLALFPNIKTIDTIEISNVVKDFSKYFSAFNLGAGENPKVNWIQADAYRVLTFTEKNYDIIISEPSNPWVTGVERLYTQEFYKIVQSRLSAGGIYAQWFHTYSISQNTLGLVMNTYASVFPYIYTFRSLGSDLIILGSNEEFTEANVKALQERFYIPEVKRELEEISITTPANLLRFEVLNSAKAYSDQELHLLDNPKLSYKAGKDFFLNRNIEIEQISESLLNLPFNFAASKTTLFSKFRDFHSADDLVKRKQLLSEACSITNAGSLDPNWLNFNRMCRGALLYAIRDGWLTYDEQRFDKVSMALLKPYDKKSWSLTESNNFLIAYERVHSDYFPIPKEELMAKTEVCRSTASIEATNCIFKLVNLLYISGNFEDADAIFKTFEVSFQDALRSQDLQDLKIVESRSKLARKSLSPNRQ